MSVDGIVLLELCMKKDNYKHYLIIWIMSITKGEGLFDRSCFRGIALRVESFNLQLSYLANPNKAR